MNEWIVEVNGYRVDRRSIPQVISVVSPENQRWNVTVVMTDGSFGTLNVGYSMMVALMEFVNPKLPHGRLRFLDVEEEME